MNSRSERSTEEDEGDERETGIHLRKKRRDLRKSILHKKYKNIDVKCFISLIDQIKRN